MELYKVFRGPQSAPAGPRLLRLCEVRNAILRELKKLFVFPSFAVLVGRSFCLCLAAAVLHLQLRADVTGSIIGYVRDASGAVLPNATLTVTQTSTGYTRTATTDASGQYSILALPPGNYRLTA